MNEARILTLQVDQERFAALDGLRRAHFPPERNHIPAHITLFHALPGGQDAALAADLLALAEGADPLPLAFPAVRFLGRGVAVEVESPPLLALRHELARRWERWLSPQDRQRYRPHVTIQNKVPPDAARRLYEELRASWRPLSGRGEALLLWRYLGGPWALLAAYPFRAGPD